MPEKQRYWFVFSIFLILIFAGCISQNSSGDIGDGVDDLPENTTANDSGTIIINAVTVPPGQAGSFTYTGVPTGTLTIESPLVVSDLDPGTYTTTQIDPAPDFDVTDVECNDSTSETQSSGDAGTRTAVINLDPGETVDCTFTNTQQGSVVIGAETIPENLGGSILFTGVPSGTIPMDGTLVVADLKPGTYTSTVVDPAPEFDVTNIECNDGASPTVSSGDAGSRSTNFQVDPGEMVTCIYSFTRRGTIVAASQSIPDGEEGTIQFTGVPSGTIPINGTLVVSNLEPGVYSSTERDPEPEFELVSVECDDGDSSLASSGDPSTRTAIYNLDPGETVTCVFTNAVPGVVLTPTITAGGTGGGTGTDPGGQTPVDGTNPFEEPDEQFENFPLPEELSADAGTYAVPKAGPWTVTNYAGQMDCGLMSMAIPESPPESGVLDVLDGGQTIIGTGMSNTEGASITMTANDQINGRYSGVFDGVEQGVPIQIQYYWQLITDEHIVGYLTSSFTSEGIECSIYRPYELFYDG